VRDFIRQKRRLNRDELRDVASAVSRWRQTHAYPLALVTPGVRNWVGQESAGDLVVAQRLKRFDRIVTKLGRFPTMRLSQMEDIAGCRAVLEDPFEVDAVATRIRRKWEVHDESDYRAAGKPLTGYRGLHLIVVRREKFVEVQLRTWGQHNWAEQVERVASRTRENLKDGEGPADLLEYFKVASDLTWQLESGHRLDPDLQDRLIELRTSVRPYFVARPRQRRR
jgi:ppGpp synthetase/RelA/SpoT-type nucleotidyltranferase